MKKGLNELKFDDKNFNKHTEYGMSLIEKSLRQNGAGRSILLDKDDRIIAGNGIVEAAGQVGFENVRVIETDGNEIIAVKRTDLSLDSKKGREMALADNATSAADLEWDRDLLLEEFDADELTGWGIEALPIDDIVDAASENTVEEYSDDTNYDLGKLYREKINKDIIQKIDKASERGELRPEIEDILRTRANQCSVFNFDEIIKFYRSGDASESEKELLKRLYLVYITPKEALEGGVLDIEKTSGEIFDKELTQGVGDDE